MTPEDTERTTKEAIAHTIVLGWRNLEDDNGNSIPYSPEKALEFLKDPEMLDFYNWVLLTANNAELFRKQFDAESEGNSPTSSPGS